MVSQQCIHDDFSILSLPLSAESRSEDYFQCCLTSESVTHVLVHRPDLLWAEEMSKAKSCSAIPGTIPTPLPDEPEFPSPLPMRAPQLLRDVHEG